MAAKNAKTSKRDEFVADMDNFAKELMSLAKGVNEGVQVSLQMRLEVFRQLASWVAIKNRLSDDPDGGALDELRNRLRSTKGPPGGGAARNPHPGGNPFNSAWNRFGKHYPDGNGGSALDAIKRALPRPDAGDDVDAGDDLEC